MKFGDLTVKQLHDICKGEGNICTKNCPLLLKGQKGWCLILSDPPKAYNLEVEIKLPNEKTKERKIEDVMDVVLEDDLSITPCLPYPFGRVAYPGETVRDFLYTVDRDREYIKTIADLNKAPTDFGIKTID